MLRKRADGSQRSREWHVLLLGFPQQGSAGLLAAGAEMGDAGGKPGLVVGEQLTSRGAGEHAAARSLPGKKLHAAEEIIFHLPAGRLVLGRVLSA